jgi:hypothetical protein
MNEKKPTAVLVHGAFAESASWNGVIERLQTEALHGGPGRGQGRSRDHRRISRP